MERAKELRTLSNARAAQLRLQKMEGTLVPREQALEAAALLAEKARTAIVDLVQAGALAVARETGADLGLVGRVLEREATAILARLSEGPRV